MTEPTTPAGQEMDLAWPGSHIDRLSWRKRIAAIEQQAAAAELERLMDVVRAVPAVPIRDTDAVPRFKRRVTACIDRAAVLLAMRHAR